MDLVEMATAHLNNVQNAISDLQNQKAKIDEEIERLSQYYQDGVKEVAKNSEPAKQAAE